MAAHRKFYYVDPPLVNIDLHYFHAYERPNLYTRTLYSNSEQNFILLFLNALHIGSEPLLYSLSMMLHIKEGPI